MNKPLIIDGDDLIYIEAIKNDVEILRKLAYSYYNDFGNLDKSKFFIEQFNVVMSELTLIKHKLKLDK